MNGCAARHVGAIPYPKGSAHDRRPASGNGSKPTAKAASKNCCRPNRHRGKGRKTFLGLRAPRQSAEREYCEVPGRARCSHGRSSRFRRKLFHGRKYLAQTGGTSRTAVRKRAFGDRDGPRGANLRPRSALLSHRELVSGPFRHSKRTEADRSLLASTPEYRTHSR